MLRAGPIVKPCLERDLIPSALKAERERKPLETTIPRESRWRFWVIRYQMVRCLAGLAWMWLTRRSPADRGRWVRQILNELGFLWVKVGQLLSLREDMFSTEFCQELAKLQYQVVGFPGELAKQQIEKELGRPVEEVFDDFEIEPFAAASVAQVHRARLCDDGTPVVVKIIRPTAEATFKRDYDFLNATVRIFTTLGLMKHFRLEELMWEVHESMNEEIDYRYEATNMIRMRKQLASHHVYVPVTYEDYCTRSLIVMEMIPGVLMTDYIELLGTDPARVAAWEDENDVDRELLGHRMFRSFMRQIFENNFFHGDPHPGNIMLLKDSRFALIDFGTTGSYEQEFLRKYMYFSLALGSGEYQKAAELMLLFSPSLPITDLSAIREDLVRVFRAWEKRSSLRTLEYHEKSFAGMVIEAARVLAEVNIVPSWALFKSDRTWATLDTSLSHLIPSADYPKMLKKYFKRRGRRIFCKTYSPWTALKLMTWLPDLVQETLLFAEPPFRRATHALGGQTGRLSELAAAACRMAAYLGLAASMSLLVGLLHQRLNIVQAWLPSALLHYVNLVPPLDTVEWIGMLVPAIWLCVTFYKLSRKLCEPEIHVPGSSVVG